MIVPPVVDLRRGRSFLVPLSHTLSHSLAWAVSAAGVAGAGQRSLFIT